MGYVGLPLALLFSEERFRVTGFDIAADKVERAQRRLLHRPHPSPAPFSSAKGGFRATADYAEIAEMDAVIICVPTPLNEYHEPDLSYVTGTVKSIAPHIHEGQLIVLESTTYPGTTEESSSPCSSRQSRGLKVARDGDELRRSRRLLARARRSRQRHRRPPRHSQGCRRLRPCGVSWPRPLRLHLPPHRPGLSSPRSRR
jgi:UDP-glucose 6-dehydrogenase